MIKDLEIKEDFEYEEFEWFIEEMESVFDIDIYMNTLLTKKQDTA